MFAQQSFGIYEFNTRCRDWASKYLGLSPRPGYAIIGCEYQGSAEYQPLQIELPIPPDTEQRWQIHAHLCSVLEAWGRGSLKAVEL